MTLGVLNATAHREICPFCLGACHFPLPNGHVTDCDRCLGRGWVWVQDEEGEQEQEPMPEPMPEPLQQPRRDQDGLWKISCPGCRGARIWQLPGRAKTCPICGGAGEIRVGDDSPVVSEEAPQARVYLDREDLRRSLVKGFDDVLARPILPHILDRETIRLLRAQRSFWQDEPGPALDLLIEIIKREP